MSTVVMQPGGPGGGALWRAEKACCRQAKWSGAVPKARLRKLVYNIWDKGLGKFLPSSKHPEILVII